MTYTYLAMNYCIAVASYICILLKTVKNQFAMYICTLSMS